jgi:hypothetical protein
MTYYHPDTPETRNPLVVSTVFGIVALLSCAARVYSVSRRSEKYGMQEWYLLIAMVCIQPSLGAQCFSHVASFWY